jgi:hypothetical protein
MDACCSIPVVKTGLYVNSHRIGLPNRIFSQQALLLSKKNNENYSAIIGGLQLRATYTSKDAFDSFLYFYRRFA